MPSLDHAGHLALERMLAAWQPLRAHHVAELVRQVGAATDDHPPGDATWIGSITLPPLDVGRLVAGVQIAIDDGRGLALDEARRQSPALADYAAAQPRPDHTTRIAAYAAGAERLLAAGLVQTASREAFRLTATTGEVDIAGHVATVLGDTAMLYERDVLQGIATGGINEGRYEVMDTILGERSSALEAADAVDSIYALEILDGNTCDECAAIDGQEYATLAQARIDYPGVGGGYVRCKGRERCRGSIVIVYGTEAPPTQLQPTTPPPPPAPPAKTDAQLLAEKLDAQMSTPVGLPAPTPAQLANPVGSVRIYDGDTMNPVTVTAHVPNGSVLVQAPGLNPFPVDPQHLSALAPPLPLTGWAAEHPIASVRYIDGKGSPVVVLSHLPNGDVMVATPGGSPYITAASKLTTGPLLGPPVPIVLTPKPPVNYETLPKLRDLETHEKLPTMEDSRTESGVRQFEQGMRHVQTLKNDTDRPIYRALDDYSGSAYTPINLHLRGVDISADGYNVVSTERAIKDLDHGFATRPAVLEEDVVVVRGSSIAEGDPLVDDVITEPSYVSTSADMQVAVRGFASRASRPGREKAVLIMHLRKGQPFLPGLLGESELLLPRGTRYVVSRELEPTVDQYAKRIRTFEVIVLRPGEGL